MRLTKIILALFLLFVMLFGCTTIKTKKDTLIYKDDVLELMNDIEIATLDKNIDGIIQHMSPSIVIKATIDTESGQMTLQISREQYKNETLKVWATTSRYEFRRENDKIIISDDNQTAFAETDVIEINLIHGQRVKTKTHEKLTMEIIDGKLLVTEIDAFVQIINVVPKIELGQVDEIQADKADISKGEKIYKFDITPAPYELGFSGTLPDKYIKGLSPREIYAIFNEALKRGDYELAKQYIHSSQLNNKGPVINLLNTQVPLNILAKKILFNYENCILVAEGTIFEVQVKDASGEKKKIYTDAIDASGRKTNDFSKFELLQTEELAVKVEVELRTEEPSYNYKIYDIQITILGIAGGHI